LVSWSCTGSWRSWSIRQLQYIVDMNIASVKLSLNGLQVLEWLLLAVPRGADSSSCREYVSWFPV
jgi:hypothetical protein